MQQVPLPTPETAAALGEVATFAGAFSMATVIEYAQLRFLADQYWTTLSALDTIGMKAILVDLVEKSTPIVVESQHVANAGILAQREKDPAERAALRKAEKTFTTSLAAAIDFLLSNTVALPVLGSPHLSDRGEPAVDPGVSPAVRGVFAPLQALRGASTTPEATRHNATLVLDKVQWCLENANLLVRAENEGKPVEEVTPKQEGAEAE